ncbi:hypothetical protein IWQ60_011151 [Tieghemiomyces parasiticus]|uniref:Uncharacterized protein n=1 Tax=Tieghemiomyces parasiticus TaxID=78921 RepID=A0A9W7ZPL3_9FUNG|nr:hypothetical protein IWQ60_011151 [Tieghemiomyces parasiticus]
MASLLRRFSPLALRARLNAGFNTSAVARQSDGRDSGTPPTATESPATNAPYSSAPNDEVLPFQLTDSLRVLGVPSLDALQSLNQRRQQSQTQQPLQPNQMLVQDMQAHMRGRYSMDYTNMSSEIAEIQSHVLNVHSGLNNTILTLTLPNGNVLVNTSGGSVGFKKAKRAGYEAAYQAMEQLIVRADERGVVIQNLHIKLKGFGLGRDASFKAMRALTNWRVVRITDCTPIPFNGCRPKKQRRL